jgi:hypothetical protein
MFIEEMAMNRMIFLTALVCISSLGHAHKVRVDFNPVTHFTQYKTYSWALAADSPSDGHVFPNQLMRDRITGFIEEALAARGLKRVATGGDLLVSYRVTVQEQPQFVTFSDGFAPGWGWDWGWESGISTTTVQTFYDGTLMIDVMDAGHKKLVFQGTSTQEISSRPEKNTQRLLKAVNSIFGKYPPCR